MERLECLVCGRKFPKGQGVVLRVKGRDYAFHSKVCALKFLRRVLEEIDENVLDPAFRRVAEEFREELEERRAKVAKKIA